MLETVEPALLAMLRQRHAEPQRHYHDWTHIEALLGHFDRLGSRIHDRDAVLHAILFHDAVYDPKADDNEQRSAQLLIESDVTIAEPSKTLAHRIILATDGHQFPDDLVGKDAEDAAHFLDMDLAILGASPERFDTYERAIRREYAHVSDAAYRAGRSAVLHKFADRDPLYFSAWGRDNFAARATRNISRSLALLGG
ncbi:MAG: hypothetical protein DI637_08145 [Citromicrobium sp.]|nr:MAG: hypothetical protein DI637_08145 [Citromicrobium sp.]